MIIVKLSGGLGNQMFQYAFGVAMSKKLQREVFYDLSFYKPPQKNVTLRPFGLHFFKIQVLEPPQNFTKLLPYPLSKGEQFKINLKRLLGKKSFILITESNIEEFLAEGGSKFSHIYFDGYWQSENYFIEQEAIIRQRFSFQHNTQKEPPIFREAMLQNAVSIHFRRGDYIGDPKTNQYHGVCSMEYYQEAIHYIANKITKPVFYIFSDDPNWVKENFHINYPYFVVSPEDNYKENEHADMHLMSLCRHNITANSTFSWWGAWLNQNPDKIVIAPKKWFNNRQKNQQARNLIPQNWVRL